MSGNPDLDRALRAYAVQTAPVDRERPPDTHLQGTVVGIASDGSRMDVMLPEADPNTPGSQVPPGTDTITRGVRVLDGAVAKVGDTVWMIRVNGGTLLILGRLVPIPQKPDVVVLPDPAGIGPWRFLSLFHQGFGGPDRVRYNADGSTWLYRLLPSDPSRCLDVVDVTDADHMAVKSQTNSPDWGTASGASAAGKGWSIMPPFQGDEVPQYIVLGGPVVGGGGNPAYQGICVVDLGSVSNPLTSPANGGTRAQTYGGISGGQAGGPLQKGNQWWWHLQYGFVWHDELDWGTVGGTAFVAPSGVLSGWAGSTQYSSPHHLINSMALHPDPASSKVYSLSTSETLIFDGWNPVAAPTVVAPPAWSGTPPNPGYGAPPMAPLRGAANPTLVGISQHLHGAFGGSADQDGVDVWYVDLTDPMNPVYSAWHACDTGPNLDIGLNASDSVGAVVATSYDASGRCFVVTRDSVNAANLTLWWLDLVNQHVLKSIALPSWGGSGQLVTGVAVTKDYKNLLIVTTSGVWALPLYS